MRKLAFGYSTMCNLRCGHCVAAGEEHHSATMGLDKGLAALEQLKEAGVEGVSFTAGEPFLFFDEMVKLVSYCSTNQIYTRIVTNGYWADSPQSIQKKLDALMEAGLSQLRISCSRFHQKQVSIDNLIKAAGYCRLIGLDCFISLVTDFCDKDAKLERQLQQSGVKYFPEPMIYAGKAKEISSEPLRTDYQSNRCMMNPYLTPDLKLYGCCDAGMYFDNTNFFYLGSIEQHSVSDLFTYFEQHPFYSLIRQAGLSQLASWSGMLSQDIIRYRKCELCIKLFNDPETVQKMKESLGQLQAWTR